ncbi:hypothetical protein pb186bvf_015089 [Paramecium bursaria]
MKLLYRYNFISKGKFTNPIQIYTSTVKNEDLVNLDQGKSFLQYGQLIPFFIEKYLYNYRQHFITDMQYSKEGDLLKLVGLNQAGLYTKLVSPQNLVPCTFQDFINVGAFNRFEYTPRIDYSLIYYNKLQNEFYVFDKEGQWTEEEIEGLSIERLYDERKYLDQYFR